MLKRTIFSFTIFLSVLFTFFSIGQAAWIVYGDLTYNSATAVVDESAPYICYNNDTGINYRTLNKALQEADSGQEIIVYVKTIINCYETIEIKSGVTLTIPFIGKTNNSSATGGNINNEETLYKIKSSDDRNLYGNKLGDAQGNVDIYRSILINMRNGSDIILNGILNLGGATSYNGNNGYYCEINLGEKSSITCNSGSIFNCFGYLKEDSSNARHSGMEQYKNIVDNSFDNERFLKVNDGAVLNTYIALYDVLSGGNLTGAISANQSPFNVFDFQALQTYTIVEHGASMYTNALVVGPSNMSYSSNLAAILPSSSRDPSLIYTKSGSIELEYKPTNVLYGSRSTNINGTNIVINGEIDIGYIELDVYTITLDTRLFHLPLSSKIFIYVRDGGIFNCNQKVKFLMGSKMIVEEGGTLNVNESLVFYNSSVAPEVNADLGIRYDSTGKDDALLLVNGTIKVNADSQNNGYLGAIITHTSTTGKAFLDFSNISANSYLSAEAKEGTANVSVIVTSSGNFISNGTIISGQFSAQTTYTSNCDGSNYYWEGLFSTTFTISVTYDKSIVHPVFDYTITISQNSDGSNAYDSSLINSSNDGSTEIASGLYFNIVVNDAVQVSITKNGIETISYSNSSWIYVDGNFDINIVPTEGIKVSLSVFKDPNFNDNETEWSAGTGHTIYYIEESVSQDGPWTETYRLKAAGITEHYVKKGYYFRIGYEWVEGDPIIALSGQNGFTANNRITTNDPNFSPQPTTEWINDTTSSLSGAFLAGNADTAPGLEYKFEMGYYSGHAKADESDDPGCLLPDTLITMADGSTKYVKDIVSGDMVKVFNHETGIIDVAPVVFNDSEPFRKCVVINLKFSNNKNVGVVSEHGFFDIDLNKYVYFTETNYLDFVGHNFYSIDSNGNASVVALLEAHIEQKYTKVYSPVSSWHLNYFTENILSMPGGISGLFNIFEYDENLKYDEELMEADIDKYGLFTYDDFKDLISYEFYSHFPVPYLKVSIGKGLISYSDIMYLIRRYSKFV